MKRLYDDKEPKTPPEERGQVSSSQTPPETPRKTTEKHVEPMQDEDDTRGERMVVS